MLVQEMGWYDRSSNGVGALCARLSGEAAQVQGVSLIYKDDFKKSVGIINFLCRLQDNVLELFFNLLQLYSWQ